MATPVGVPEQKVPGQGLLGPGGQLTLQGQTAMVGMPPGAPVQPVSGNPVPVGVGSSVGAGAPPSVGAGPPSVGAGPQSLGAGPPSLGAGPPSLGAGPPSLGAGSPSLGVGPSVVAAGAPGADTSVSECEVPEELVRDGKKKKSKKKKAVNVFPAWSMLCGDVCGSVDN